jgi:hypothetical protein
VPCAPSRGQRLPNRGHGRGGELSHPVRIVRLVTEHLYEARCACRASWRVLREEDDDAMSTCLNCGADCFDLTDIGEIRHAGRDVNN